MKLQKIVAQNLKGYRQLRGLSQEAIAGKIDIGANHYARIERGEEGLTLERWEKICKVIKIEPYLLLIADSYKQEIS